MKSLLLTAILASLAVVGINAQSVAFANDIHSMNTDAYVLLGNFELEHVAPPKDNRWGRHRPPRRIEHKPGELTRTEFDYVQPMLDDFYQVIDCARRIKKEDIRTQEELKSFLNSTPLPVYALDGVIQKIQSTAKYNERHELLSYSANLSLRYRIIDLRTNTKIDEFTSISSGYSSGRDVSLSAAMNRAFNSAEKQIITHLNDLFPTYGSVLQIDAIKKDEAKSVYVDLGQQDGITTSNHFHVYEIAEIAGRSISTKIGKLKVTAINGADICSCKVTSGGDKILAASKAGKKLAVVSYAGFWE